MKHPITPAENAQPSIAATEPEFLVRSDLRDFLLRLVGSVSIAAQRDRSWWRRRRLQRLADDLAFAHAIYAEEERHADA